MRRIVRTSSGSQSSTMSNCRSSASPSASTSTSTSSSNAAKSACCCARSRTAASSRGRQQRLNFLPLPQGQGSLRPGLADMARDSLLAESSYTSSDAAGLYAGSLLPCAGFDPCAACRVANGVGRGCTGPLGVPVEVTSERTSTRDVCSRRHIASAVPVQIHGASAHRGPARSSKTHQLSGKTSVGCEFSRAPPFDLIPNP
jgi:hypothetical protein